MREEELGLQTRGFNSLFGQKTRALLNRFEDSHPASLNRNDALEQGGRARQNRGMNARMNFLFAVALFCLVAASCADGAKSAKEPAINMQITSAAFAEGQPVPDQYTCSGSDVSPPLRWTGAPAGVKSFAIITDDPDAPTGIWVHWVIYNLPPATTSLAENVPQLPELPGGARQGINDFGKIGYNGPCPPPGKPHHYHFRIYALDTMLDLKPGATREKLLDAMDGHILAEGQLMGTCQKQ
jgi:Raf kinase inhibitor-like YbhB/YbcL family protein